MTDLENTRGGRRWIQVLPDPAAVALRAAAVASLRLRAAVRARGRFRIALTCNPFVAVMFDALAQMPLPWTDVEIFQVSDHLELERAERDLTMLASIFRPTGARIMPMPLEASDLDEAACSYGQLVGTHLDLALLILSSDGTAVPPFTGDPAFDGRDVVAMRSPERIVMSMTAKGLSRAGEILWITTGASNAVALLHFFAGGSAVPAAQIVCRRARYIADAAAAELVARQSPPGIHLWYRGGFGAASIGAPTQ